MSKVLQTSLRLLRRILHVTIQTLSAMWREFIRAPWMATIFLVFLYFIFVSKTGTPDSHPIPDLEGIGFTIPDSDKPDVPSLPDKPSPTTIIYGEGTVVVADSILDVTLTAIEYGLDNRGVIVTVGADTVAFQHLDWWEDENSDWRIVGEVTTHLDIGVGVAREVIEIRDIHVGPAIVVDTKLDWVAVEAVGWRYITDHISVDVGIGARLSKDGVSPHLSAGIGIDI